MCFGPAPGGSRWNRTTCPRLSRNSAVMADSIVMVPGWSGLPQPGGGLPLPSDSGWSASYQWPEMSASSIPQCVYSVYATGVLAVAVAGWDGRLGLADVGAGLAHPALVTARSAASSVADMNFIPPSLDHPVGRRGRSRGSVLGAAISRCQVTVSCSR